MLSPAQTEFLNSRATFRGFVGGRGAGKSMIGTYDLLKRAKAGRLYMVIAPTYPVLRDATLRSFLDNCRRLGTELRFNKNEMLAEVGCGVGEPAEVVFRSADNPELLRGPNLSGVVIDEASVTPREAFDIPIASLREGGEQGWLSALFTPKGKLHWTYEVFGPQADGRARADTELFRARTADNPFLPETFEATVRRQYTALFAEQELEGAFLDPAGLMFAVGRIGVVEAAPARATRVRYWDKAGTSDQEKNAADPDYTAGVLMSRGPDGLFTVEDVRRGRWSCFVRNEAIRQAAALDRERHRDAGPLQIWVEQEPGSGGKESAQISMRELAGHAVYAERVTGKLPARAAGFAAQVEAGNVRVVRAAWNKDFLDELAAFPTEGVHDDQVAAAAGAFNKLCDVPSGAAPGSRSAPDLIREPGHGPALLGRDFAGDWGLFGMGGR